MGRAFAALRALLLVLAGLGGVVGSARASIVTTAIGNPVFVPTDFHLFTAPIGTAASGYAEFVSTLQTILPPPDHVLNPALGIGPGAPHPGPYDTEIGQGVAAAGYRESTTFSTSDYSNGNGVYLAFMLVPGAGAPIGSSPDFASGPIIPDTIFPLSAANGTFTNGVFNDGSALTIPATSDASLPGLDGYSHIPYFLADNFDFALNPVAGAYEYRITILDDAGNGYRITAAFSVPEPASALLLLPSVVGLWAARDRRRRRPGT